MMALSATDGNRQSLNLDAPTPRRLLLQRDLG